jgi:hypothetical protein
MNVIANENIRPFDVDNTLIIPLDSPNGGFVHVVDPLCSLNSRITFRIHEPNLRLLKEELARGSVVLVWSRSGYQWAHNVMQALGFTTHDNLYILSKPTIYFDDVEVGHWLKDRVFLDANQPYKGYNPNNKGD